MIPHKEFNKKVSMLQDKSGHNISKVFLLILLFGILIRLVNLSQPLLEGASTRQIQTAMIARNYFNHGFKLFYPQADNFGNNPGYMMQEFYIIPFIAALLYKLLGGVHEAVLRLLSVFFYILSALMIYKLASYFYNKKVGVISLFCFTLSPLSIYLGRAVHPEMLMIFFIMGTILYFSIWINEEKRVYWFWAAVSFIMAVLLKIPNLYLFLPLFVLVFLKYQWDFIKKKDLWLFLLITLLPIFLFNYHQHLVRMQFPNPDMENFKPQNIIQYIKIFLTGKAFYKASFQNLISYTLTPIGFTFFVLALLLKIKEKKEWLFHFWILSVIIFFLLMPAQSIQGYYQIHLLPAASILIGKLVYDFQNSQFYKEKFINKKPFIILFLFLIFGIVFRYSFAYFKTPENLRNVVETGKAVRQLTEKNALVISSIENGPDLLYYSNRKGWPFMIHLEEKRESHIRQGMDVSKIIYDPIERMEFLRSKGGKYFASASVKEFNSHEKFSNYMLKNYKILIRNSDFIIFNLKEKKL